MRIDKRLNLVVPIFGDAVPRVEGGKPVVEAGKPVVDTPVVAWVHSTPLSADAVDAHFMLLAQTFSRIFNLGLGNTAGPAVAARVLRDVATNSGAWGTDGAPGPGRMLMEEIRRLTMVSHQTPQGWQSLPLDVAVQQGALSAEDKSEVENVIVFFIACSATLPREHRRALLTAACDLWDAQLSSSTPMEWNASLKTSSAHASTGERSPAPVAAGETAGTVSAMLDGRPVAVPR